MILSCCGPRIVIRCILPILPILAILAILAILSAVVVDR